MNLQAEYDNGAKVPNYPSIAAQWLHEAASFRIRHRHAELSIAYGPTERQAVDLFWPESGRNAPVVIFIHGGYWQRSHRLAFSHLAKGFLDHGVAVAMPSYDLCPTVTLAALVEQVRDAIAFLHNRLGQRFLVIGHSAGGHLAAMSMATDWVSRGAPRNLVAAGMPISGLFDLYPLTHTTVNAALGLDAAEARRLSPVLMASPGGLLHAYVGGDEGAEYMRQTRSIAEAWGGSWEIVPNSHHFAIVEELQNPASALIIKALTLIPGL